jgi:hypothetical protein
MGAKDKLVGSNDTYQVCITDESGEVVYEKPIKAVSLASTSTSLPTLKAITPSPWRIAMSPS